MGKRGNSEGSLTKRPDGRWEARISLAQGKRKSYYAKTRQEAARLLAAAMRDRDTGLPVVGEKQTVAQFCTAWLTTVRPTIRPRTWQRYHEYIMLHALPKLGALPLARLTPQHVHSLDAAKLEAGLSSSTVNHLHDVLHRALDVALRQGLVQRNVTELVGVPRMAHHEMRVLSPEQARRLLEAAEGDRLESLYVLALTTGARQGKLLALRWPDVDLDKGILAITATLQRSREGVSFAPPRPTDHVGRSHCVRWRLKPCAAIGNARGESERPWRPPGKNTSSCSRTRVGTPSRGAI